MFVPPSTLNHSEPRENLSYQISEGWHCLFSFTLTSALGLGGRLAIF
jgi:hypothetical protein